MFEVFGPKLERRMRKGGVQRQGAKVKMKTAYRNRELLVLKNKDHKLFKELPSLYYLIAAAPSKGKKMASSPTPPHA